jgi:hypothetical protein
VISRRWALRTGILHQTARHLKELHTDKAPNMSEQYVSTHLQSQNILNASQSTENDGQESSTDADVAVGEFLTTDPAYNRLKLFKDQGYRASFHGHHTHQEARICRCQVGQPFHPVTFNMIGKIEKFTPGGC